VGPYIRICIRRLDYVLARAVDWKTGGADGGLWGHEKRKSNILDDLLVQRGKPTASTARYGGVSGVINEKHYEPGRRDRRKQHEQSDA